MSHYFTPDPSEVESRPKRFTFLIGQTTYEMESDAGVFSKQGLDFGSRLLLESFAALPKETVLDLGCGTGAIGIVLAKRDHALVTMADINRRALGLAKTNAKRNGVAVNVLASDGFVGISGTFDRIVTNPPIRAGKKVIYAWFEQAKNYLNPGGSLILVIRKDQGAPSAQKELSKHFGSVETLAKKSGYFVFLCRKD